MSSQSVRVGGRTLRVSNLEKVLYPATGTTKGEVLSYYVAHADRILPELADRPDDVLARLITPALRVLGDQRQLDLQVSGT